MNGQVRRIRKAKGLTQSDLPGVPRTTVSRVERAAGSTTLNTLSMIAERLDVPLASLLVDEKLTLLPTIHRMLLSEFLAELAHFFEGSGLEKELQPKEKWVERCQWAMQKLLERK